jgi:hypothetical protein
MGSEELREGGAAGVEGAEGEDAVDGGDASDEGRPDGVDKVHGEGVVERGVAPDLLEDVKAVALHDVFCRVVRVDDTQKWTQRTHSDVNEGKEDADKGVNQGSAAFLDTSC